MRKVLTPHNDEPPVGSIVRDALGDDWVRLPEGYWVMLDHTSDPESWVKVAGNYGPVRLIRAGGA